MTGLVLMRSLEISYMDIKIYSNVDGSMEELMFGEWVRFEDFKGAIANLKLIIDELNARCDMAATVHEYNGLMMQLKQERNRTEFLLSILGIDRDHIDQFIQHGEDAGKTP